MIKNLSAFAILVSLLTLASGAQAQGRACVDGPDSEACSECEASFPQTTMTSLMCYNGGEVPTAVEVHANLSCDFNQCPADFSEYEQCIDQGRILADSNEIRELEDRVSVLIEGTLATLCNPEVRDPLIADVEALASTYEDFTLASGNAMADCLNAEITTQQALIESERNSAGEGALGRLRDVRIRRAGDNIQELYRLRGLRTVIGYSERGEALANLRALSNELPSLCN